MVVLLSLLGMPARCRSDPNTGNGDPLGMMIRLLADVS